MHTYGTGLYQYADMMRLISLMTQDDLAVLEQMLDRYQLRAAGYYVLRRLQSAFGMAPNAALGALMSRLAVPQGPDCRRENDFGDMWDKLWGSR